MAVQVHWHNESRTIIRFTQGNMWTWPEFDAAVDRAAALMNTVNHRVDVIVDVRASPTPLDMHALGHFQQAQHFQPTNFGRVVVVSHDPFMARLGGVFIRVFGWMGSNPRFARSYGEAERLLEQARVGAQPVM